ncbi:hypothetical protein ACFOG5_08835 [Pedobacter fastidiosus]
MSINNYFGILDIYQVYESMANENKINMVGASTKPDVSSIR